MTAPILILTALKQESNAIAHTYPGWKKPYPIIPVGIRAKYLCNVPAPAPGTLIILAGMAGALDPLLRIGSCIIDDPEGRVPAQFGIRGVVHTTDKIVATPDAKRELRQSTGASAVDMEQSIVRAWAQLHGAYCVGVRAISDQADEALDAAMIHWVNELGTPRPLRIAASILKNPCRIRDATRLGRAAKIACESLGRTVVDITEALNEPRAQ